MGQNKNSIQIGDVRAATQSYVEDGQALDTSVSIGGEVACCVHGSQLAEFEEELNAVIDKYRL